MKSRAHKIYLIIVSNLLAFAFLVAAVSADSTPSPLRGGGAAPMTSVGTAITYQGLLILGGTPANGQYDFQFTLYDALAGGTVKGGPVPVSNQTVSNGYYSVQIDFGPSMFTGDARWLEIAERPAGGGTYTTLTPRQPLSAVPYAQSLMPGAAVVGAPSGSLVMLNVTNTANLDGATGIQGNSSASTGVRGYGGIIGVFGNGLSGVYGTTTSANGQGVIGYNFGTGGIGVEGSGQGTGSIGVDGVGYYGLYGVGTSFGVYGQNNSIGGVGVYGYNPSNIGVYGQGGYAVYGSGIGNGSKAIYGNSVGTGSYAGYFSGNVRILGGCCGSAALTTQTDDPLDPANKYLNQAAVESQDMLDVLNGNVTTNAQGNATISLPAYFQATNRDFRYQLTVVGKFAQAIVSSELSNNQFSIATDKPSVKVSWQVTGVRDDPYAKAHPLTPEQDKPSDERGYYLNPELYGQPAGKSVDRVHGAQPPSNPPSPAPPTQPKQPSQPTQPGGK